MEERTKSLSSSINAHQLTLQTEFKNIDTDSHRELIIMDRDINRVKHVFKRRVPRITLCKLDTN